MKIRFSRWHPFANELFEILRTRPEACDLELTGGAISHAVDIVFKNDEIRRMRMREAQARDAYRKRPTETNRQRLSRDDRMQLLMLSELKPLGGVVEFSPSHRILNSPGQRPNRAQAFLANWLVTLAKHRGADLHLPRNSEIEGREWEGDFPPFNAGLLLAFRAVFSVAGKAGLENAKHLRQWPEDRAVFTFQRWRQFKPQRLNKIAIAAKAGEFRDTWAGN